MTIAGHAVGDLSRQTGEAADAKPRYPVNIQSCSLAM
jgi:hypothetical protein